VSDRGSVGILAPVCRRFIRRLLLLRVHGPLLATADDDDDRPTTPTESRDLVDLRLSRPSATSIIVQSTFRMGGGGIGGGAIGDTAHYALTSLRQNRWSARISGEASHKSGYRWQRRDAETALGADPLARRALSARSCATKQIPLFRLSHGF
jgi:hypothetical protein